MTLGWPQSHPRHGNEEKSVTSHRYSRARQSTLELSEVPAVFRSLTFIAIAFLK
jgi:hypothetical protein